MRPERAIAKLAARQRGVVTRDQLREIGMTSDAIDHWLGSARLHSLYRGVYLLGHAGVTEGARELGAVLACGPGAVLSYRSAAWLWRLLAEPSEAHDVTVPGRKLASRRGIRIHWVAALDPRDVRKLGGIPVTSPARTILDLAAIVKPRVLEQAIAEAYARRLARRSDLAFLLARRSSRPGTRALRALLDDGAPALTRSQAEERLLSLIRSAELPQPEVNRRIGRYEVDFLWRDRRLVVEVDGFAYHSSRSAFERDRRRGVELGALGYRVLRVTWRQIVDQPEALIARLAAALHSPT